MTKLLIKEINDCLECPKLFICSLTKNFNAKQRFQMKVSLSHRGILKNCPLPNKPKQ